MIVYGFYGLGKSTFVARHKDITIDLDEQDYMLSIDFVKSYAELIYANDKKGKIVFTNVRTGIINDSDIDIAFIPENINMVAKRLRQRGVCEAFIKDLVERETEIFHELKLRFPNAIIVAEDEFLCDYEDLIIGKGVRSMELNIFGYPTEHSYVDLDGKPIGRTPLTNTYNYDEYVTWKKDESINREKADEFEAVYSDRLWQWDSGKFNKCCQDAFGDTGQYFSGRKPENIEKFLSLYFDKKIELQVIVQGCNQSSGYPYWVFFYKKGENA